MIDIPPAYNAGCFAKGEDYYAPNTGYLYGLWSGMHYRIHSRMATNYPDYGGRGLTMYKPWITSKDIFVEWVLDNLGHKPDRKLSLDRIDNDYGYYPYQLNGELQLRWADAAAQSRNQRKRNRREHRKDWIRTAFGWKRRSELHLHS